MSTPCQTIVEGLLTCNDVVVAVNNLGNSNADVACADEEVSGKRVLCAKQVASAE